jgi:hypothetical protein
LTRQVRHISVSINRLPDEVYSFVSNPENVPKWATGLGDSIKNVNGEWLADSPMGKVKVKFAEQNRFGVLDHEVELESGVNIKNRNDKPLKGETSYERDYSGNGSYHRSGNGGNRISRRSNGSDESY